MPLSVCPTDIVDAPIETVWSLLTDPAGYGEVFDVRVVSVAPAGPAAAGQEVRLTTGWGPFRLPLRFEIIEVDHANHRLAIDVRLPFGVRNDERLSCAAAGERACRVTYGCNFVLPDGWRGAVLRALFARGFEKGPADSLRRLKRSAEVRSTAIAAT